MVAEQARRPHPVLVVLTIALAARLLALWTLEPTPSIADERGYLQTARHLLRLGVGWIFDADQAVPYSSPPVVPTLYALAWSLLGESERAARLINVAAGALAVVPTMSLARRLGGGAVALAAGLLVALHPDLITYSMRLWTEPVYTLIVLTALARLAADPSPRQSVGVGALLGLAALTRESGLALPLIAVAWTGASWNIRLPRAGLMAAGFLLVVAPYVARLAIDPKPEGLVARSSAFNLYIGNVRGGERFHDLGDTPEERDDRARELALEVITADPLGWASAKLTLSVSYFVDQTTLSVVQWFARPPDPRRARPRFAALDDDGARAALAWSTRALQTALLALGALGWSQAPWRQRRDVVLVLLALIVATWLPTWLTLSKPRFALPCIPAVLIGAAWLARGREAWSGGSQLAAGMVIAAGVVWLAA
jgi:4-amino-4-deoxy-L-arabinose transferase-like glycosyltransferase